MSQEIKLKLFGMLAITPDLDLRTVVQKLGIPLATLKRWKEEHIKAIDFGKLEKVIDLPTVIADRIVDVATESVVEEMVKALPESEELIVDEATNQVISASDYANRETERAYIKAVQEAAATQFKSDISSIKDLAQSTKDTAKSLIALIDKEITEIAQRNDVFLADMKGRTSNTKEILDLVNAVSNIQNAFFNKPSTTIIPPGDSKMLGTFRNKMTS